MSAFCTYFAFANSNECSAWVQAWASIGQAVGALLALWIAIVINRKDRRAIELDRDAENRTRKESLFTSALVFAVTTVNELQILRSSEEQMDTNYVRRSRARIEDLLRWSQPIDLTSISALGAQALVGIRADAMRVGWLYDDTTLTAIDRQHGLHSICFQAEMRRDDLMNAISQAGFDADRIAEVACKNPYLGVHAKPQENWKYPPKSPTAPSIK